MLIILLRAEALLSNFNASALCRSDILASLALGLEEQETYMNSHYLKVKTELSSGSERLRFARYGTSKNLWLQKYLPPEKRTCLIVSAESIMTGVLEVILKNNSMIKKIRPVCDMFGVQLCSLVIIHAYM